MASPATNDAHAPEEEDFEALADSETDIDDAQSSIPPSPELGMAREDVDIVDAALTIDDEEDVADLKQGQTSKPGNDATSELDTEDMSTNHPSKRWSQQSPSESVQGTIPELTNVQSPTPASTCPPTRRSARAVGTLVYDQKYHPMDDFIRPSQAAKRRSLHGERPALADDSNASSPEDSGSDVGSMVGDEDSDDDNGSQPPRKRKRPKSRTPEPTRRSSRRKANPKVSYNMQIHPQDSDLQRVYACDGSKSSPLPKKQASFRRYIAPSREESPEGTIGAWCPLFATSPEELSTESSKESPPEPSLRRAPVSEPLQYLIGTPIDLYPNLCPDIAYLTGDQNPCPHTKGLPFHIYTEHIEDQLNAEAEAASPLHFDHDDKENHTTNPELIPEPNPLDDISIIPASHYRQHSGNYMLNGHGPMASNAFYMHPRFEASPYGLGWSDGAYDLNNSNAHYNVVPDYMRILASSENLLRASRPESPSDESQIVVGTSPLRTLEGIELLR